MKKYVCTACSYVYDPEKGDPETGVPAGTPWEEVPADWTCPLCGLGKEVFEAEEQPLSNDRASVVRWCPIIIGTTLLF